jgi:hypothetical protein
VTVPRETAVFMGVTERSIPPASTIIQRLTHDPCRSLRADPCPSVPGKARGGHAP